ncbi:sugar transferase [Aquamicrobium zhengzhouense]|uniref:Sugar transferase n=1 Tax=Aquamicrobium zhengzhouense TaxID=2781738 RepID=A0ABS0S7H7_9HYPH|nr:sugar transferase [Aquamicrobium zhengzhouense]MBI1619244.1 sugar transferase [Aquamicrobium zhengzhouense]
MADIQHELVPGAGLDIIGGVEAEPRRRIYRMAKRCLDIAATLAAAPVVLPVVGVAALLIRIEGGPAFYSQMRVGKDGQVFRMWKLRSMRPNAAQMLEEYLEKCPEARCEWELHQKLRQDPRITKLGRFLRKYSLDELPQLWNVFAGQMALVGPRPFLPEQRSQYPGYEYYSMRPGLTGLWQVSERNNCTFAERALHDTRYAKMMSFGTDIKIMIKTVAVVINGTGH